MIITNYISKNIVYLSENDTIGRAEQIIVNQEVSHLPVVTDGKIKGNIGLKVIKDLDKKDTIGEHLIELEQFYLFEKAIIFDSLHVLNENETNIIPIITIKEEFVGVVLEETIIEEFATNHFITEFGVYMIITTPIRKYSMSEISNIVESNNGHILGLIVIKTDEESTQLVLKINAENISSIGDTFERFGYRISNKYFEDSKQELLKERYNQLQKFMEV